MRDIRFLLKTHYAASHALVIGINQYANASPLSYAVSDAEAIRDLLISDFGFPSANVRYLADTDATKQNIQKAFFRFTRDDVGLDDRILVFFAGHGHTLTGSRGEIGFLVPHDADMSDYSTFIRWDDLTKNTELIRSKHVLFIMDACYGGLALTRHTQPGSARFLKDMMLRHARQVLTAGKADEVVSDAGGPLPDHSVFTGHLIEALQGKAASDGGVITATAVMAYVYGKVANDRNSNQTPHYGHFDGDGDFIFKAPGLSALESAQEKDLDQLISVPFPDEVRDIGTRGSKVSRAKSLLATEASSIELHDFLVHEMRRFLAATSDDLFRVSGQYTKEEFVARLNRYEEAVTDLALLLACVAYWGKPSHLPSLQKCIARSCDRLEVQSGLSPWLELRWYPLLLQLYYAGIAAVDAQRYDSLFALFYTPAPSSEYQQHDELMAEAVGKHLLELTRSNVLKQIPGHENNYVPLSEYLFKLIQPQLDDLLFLGKNYEQAFDTFEVFFALVIADLRKVRGQGAWGPFGRFGWKQRRGEGAPLMRVIAEGTTQKEAWPPLRAGFFGGSFERFEKVASEYVEQANRLSWF
jgi:hypothetical protein